MSQVKERPILMSAPMVVALLNGSKTQTRRIVKAAPGKQSEWLTPELLHSAPEVTKVGFTLGEYAAQFTHPKGGPLGAVICPYGQPGERLWVRETWHIWGAPGRQAYDYAATCPDAAELKWKPSIHMPRAASRILLEIVSVRVKRLQDISEADAVAEGVQRMPLYEAPRYWYQNYLVDYGLDMCGNEKGKAWKNTAVESYETLWAKINGLESWDANPWVWAVEFRRVQP